MATEVFGKDEKFMRFMSSIIACPLPRKMGGNEFGSGEVGDEPLVPVVAVVIVVGLPVKSGEAGCVAA